MTELLISALLIDYALGAVAFLMAPPSRYRVLVAVTWPLWLTAFLLGGPAVLEWMEKVERGDGEIGRASNAQDDS
jgi:hypothetical protein